MQKYAVLYAKYAEVYILHILHLYVLPTLLMTGPRLYHSADIVPHPRFNPSLLWPLAEVSRKCFPTCLRFHSRPVISKTVQVPVSEAPKGLETASF